MESIALIKWPELAAVAGPGFRDITRLASTSPDLSHDISVTNRDNLLHWMDRMIEELRRLRRMIQDEEGQEEVRAAFKKIQTARDGFLKAPPPKPGTAQAADTKSPSEHVMTFMVGEYVIKRTKEIEEAMKERERHDERPGRERRER